MGLSLAGIRYMETMPVTQGKWRRSEKYVCRTCGGPAYVHPLTAEILGCKTCRFTAYETSVFFVLARNGDR